MSQNLIEIRYLSNIRGCVVLTRAFDKYIKVYMFVAYQGLEYTRIYSYIYISCASVPILHGRMTTVYCHQHSSVHGFMDIPENLTPVNGINYKYCDIENKTWHPLALSNRAP